MDTIDVPSLASGHQMDLLGHVSDRLQCLCPLQHFIN